MILKNYSQVKNVIFDFGGVILDIDYNKTELALQKLMHDKSHAGFAQKEQSGLFDDIETGKISKDEFRNGLRKLCGNLEVLDGDLDKAWNALLGGIIPGALDVVKTVGKSRRVFLLSNTNAIHLEHIYAGIENELASVEEFEGAFEKVYFSHLMGLRKPHVEIFEQVMKENDLGAEHTLFIDDSIQHIEGAKKLGLHTHFLEGDLADLDWLIDSV